jgi:hypothetical protein
MTTKLTFVYCRDDKDVDIIEGYQALITLMMAEGMIREMKPNVFEMVGLVEPQRWKPEEGESYWWLSVEKVVQAWTGNWRNHRDDRLRWELGNCFKIKAEAERAGDKLKEGFLDFHKHY